jgi:hypothetical protein
MAGYEDGSGDEGEFEGEDDDGGRLIPGQARDDNGEADQGRREEPRAESWIPVPTFPRVRQTRDDAEGVGEEPPFLFPQGLEEQAPGDVREPEPDAPARIAPGKHRRAQVVRTGGRKLFDEAAQAAFFEWFAATANLAWSAEMAGFNYKTVLRHRMNDERFAEGYDRALAQAYARVEAKRLETKRRETPIGIEGDRDAPEMEEMSPERMDAILRDRDRALARGGAGSERRRQGKRPRIASNAEVREALIKRLWAYRKRVRAQPSCAEAKADEEAPPPSFGWAPSPGKQGKES